MIESEEFKNLRSEIQIQLKAAIYCFAGDLQRARTLASSSRSLRCQSPEEAAICVRLFADALPDIQRLWYVYNTGVAPEVRIEAELSVRVTRTRHRAANYKSPGTVAMLRMIGLK